MIMTSNDLRYFLKMSDSTLRTWRLLGMPHVVLKKGYSYDSDKVREWLYSKSIKEVKYAKYLRRLDLAINEHTNRAGYWF